MSTIKLVKEPIKLKLGVNEGISNAEYHADKEYISSSSLKLLLDDPAKFYDQVILGNRPVMKSDALDMGTLVHTLVLEPHMFDKEFVVFNGWRKAGAAWEAFKAEHEGRGRIMISLPQHEKGKAYAASLKARPEAYKYLKDGQPELSITAEVAGVKVKMRADFLSESRGYINDVKTTGHPAGKLHFSDAVSQFSYDLSTGLYTIIAEQHYGRKFDFYWTVVSKADLVCDVYKCAAKTMTKGKSDTLKALDIYKKCIETGIWVSTATAAGAKLDAEENGTYVIEEV